MNAFFPGFEEFCLIGHDAVAREVRGHTLDCGHYLPEEQPDEIARQLESFLP